MFQVYVGSGDAQRPFVVLIEGCPESGIAAVDFRRQVGLPEQPTNQVSLPGFKFEDEAFVRANFSLADDYADIHLDRQHLQGWACDDQGNVAKLSSRGMRQPHGYGYAGTGHYAEPAAIAAYLVERTPETARGLLRSIFGWPARTRADAETQAQAFTERLAAARDLLADEINSLKAQLQKREAEVESLKAQLTKLRLGHAHLDAMAIGNPP